MMDGMPGPTDGDSIPDEVKVALNVTGDPINYRILLFLLHTADRESGSRFGPIRDAVPEKKEITVRRHLDKLEEAGVVISDIPKGQDRRGLAPRYRVDAPKLRTMLDMPLTHLFEGPGAAEALDSSDDS
ncbi:hypothetical protein HQQ81_20985 [Microbacteriaceae bacterium VKM Ac-2854]|nr:hypothetical protein [Microbacteriaceae bacterium VKM Ac-2854]